MAKHPTPSLSYGSPLPAYFTTPSSEVADAVELLRAGLDVHVPDQDTARAVLAALGWDADKVEQRIAVAEANAA